jgi:hypothetical protein
VTVEDQEVIDAIAVHKASGEVILTVSDHLPWDDDNHLLTLQTKLNRYLDFIESGELLEKYPDAKGRPVRIDVVCQFAPSDMARRFLELAGSTIRKAGSTLSWRVLAA